MAEMDRLSQRGDWSLHVSPPPFELGRYACSSKRLILENNSRYPNQQCRSTGRRCPEDPSHRSAGRIRRRGAVPGKMHSFLSSSTRRFGGYCDMGGSIGRWQQTSVPLSYAKEPRGKGAGSEESPASFSELLSQPSGCDHMQRPRELPVCILYSRLETVTHANKITRANAGGVGRLPIGPPWAARIAQFWRCATRRKCPAK